VAATTSAALRFPTLPSVGIKTSASAMSYCWRPCLSVRSSSMALSRPPLVR
jgi:hypothetical protein